MRFVWSIFLIWATPFFASAGTFSVFEENGKIGLKNDDGKILIPAQYEALGWSQSSFIVVGNVIGYRVNNQWGLITLDNKKITKAEYADLNPAEGSLFIARKKASLSLRLATGCINASGKQVIPFLYDGLKITSLRVIAFLKTGDRYNYGLLDFENRTLIPLNYKNIYPIGSLRFAVENFDRKISIFSDAGKQLSDFSIDSISMYRKNYAVIYRQQKQGLIDRDGVVKVEPKFREIKQDGDGFFARESDVWFFTDGQNKLIQKLPADDVEPLGKNLLKVTIAGVVRFADAQLKPVGDQSYNSVGKFKYGKAMIERDGRFGLIRENTLQALPPVYDTLRWTPEYILAATHQEGKRKWAILDTLGKQITVKRYDRIEEFNTHFFPVKLRGYWGGVDAAGKEIIACVYDSIVQSLGTHVVVKFRGQYGIIDLKETWIITPRPAMLELVTEERFLEHTSRTRFLRSYNGQPIYFTDNPVTVKGPFLFEQLPSGTIWKIDMQGLIADRQVQPEERVERIFPESEGLRGILRDGRYGFVDSRGRLRIANRYEDIAAFHEGLAPAKIRGKWGFINHEDKIAIQPAYESVSAFTNGFSMVKSKGLTGMIDKTGKQVLPTRFEDAQFFPSGRLLIRQEGVYGLADANGKTLILPKYTSLIDTDNGFVIVSRGGHFGLLTLQGISTVPLVYDAIVYDPYEKIYLLQKKAEWIRLTL